MTLCLTRLGYSQSGISLYHLKNTTFQGNNMNPAFIPEGKVFFGLPVLSGIAIDINSPYSYNDAIKKEEGIDSLDIDKLVQLSNDKNSVLTEAEISTFYLGFRTSANTAISLFVRERIAARSFYSDDLVDFAWNGNKNYAGQTLDLSTTMTDVRYYREYGIGLWKRLPKQKIDIGIRAKLINGMVSVITDRDFSGSISIDDDYNHHIQLSNARVNTSGINMFENGSDDEIQSYATFNNNLGFGMDLGFNWQINKQFSASLAVNDLGFINWKADPKNYWVADTSFVFGGLELRDVDNIADAFEDSLINKLDDSTTYQSYRSGLNTSIYASGSYNLTTKDMFTATIATHVVQDRTQFYYALGYTRKFGQILALSANVIRKPQQGIDMGLGAAVTLGAVQLYLASDQIIRSFDVPNTSSFDLRFGINFIFGRKKVVEDRRNDLDHPSPYGKKEKVEKSDGIYWIVPVKKPRPIYNEKPGFTEK
ncbi:DUF5723 family protein [Reichenbachiella sp. MSK19-1]|uniref:DUF5723 family protein n=1 Tax=Reichenbachiella sp. MSK19-1 TaxID=1897631 RepID=UPI001314C6E9|nr:DUF5723 family protein [Reichenbachiella sp. MSK19-1]